MRACSCSFLTMAASVRQNLKLGICEFRCVASPASARAFVPAVAIKQLAAMEKNIQQNFKHILNIYTAGLQPSTSRQAPTVSGPQASTSVQAPMVSGLQTSTSLQAPMMSGLQASTSLQAPTVSGLQGPTSLQAPTVSGVQGSISVQAPTVSGLQGLLHCRVLRCRDQFNRNLEGIQFPSVQSTTYGIQLLRCRALKHLLPCRLLWCRGLQTSTSLQAPVVSGLQASTSLQAPTVSGLQGPTSLQATQHAKHNVWHPATQ